MQIDGSRFPEFHRNDIRAAIHILKKAGCSEVFLFRSRVLRKRKHGNTVALNPYGAIP